MDKKLITSIRGNVVGSAIVSAILAGVCLLTALCCFSLYTSGYVELLDVILIIAVAIWLGVDFLGRVLAVHIKNKIAMNTWLEIYEDKTVGMANGIKFEIYNTEIVSCTIQNCEIDFKGNPIRTNPGFYTRFLGGACTFLVILTESGRNYNIGNIVYPETAKNTIDSIIARNNIMRMRGEM